jgi:hypothetical protein
MDADSDSISHSVWVTGFLDDADPDACRSKVAAVFGSPPEKIELLFRSIPCQVKDQLDESSAQRYAAAFQLVGLRTEVRRKQTPGAAAATPVPAQAPSRKLRLPAALRDAAPLASRYALPAVLVLGLLTALATLAPKAWHAALPASNPPVERADFAALQLGPLDESEQRLLTQVRSALRAERNVTPLFVGVLLDVARRASPPACRIELAPHDSSGKPVPAWFSMSVLAPQHSGNARVAVPRYFLNHAAPTLVVDGRRLPMGEGLTPQTAGVVADLDLMQRLLKARAVEVQFGREAAGEVTYTYDVSQLASALRIAREVCGAAAGPASPAS